MAKALYGHVGLGNPNTEESARLRRRIADLEAEVLRLNLENDHLREISRADSTRVLNAELVDH